MGETKAPGSGPVKRSGRRKSAVVLPSAIPWEKLVGKDLEECTYWLIDAMGGKDLEWRVGGAGQGATDQGRDLQAAFYGHTPEGDLRRELWWVEAKGRKSTVPPDEVKKSVHHVAGVAEVDVLALVTNTHFSNPTKDWVREWQAAHPRPRIHLWERQKLEKLLSERPEVVVRLFAEALSPQGRLEVVRSRFWNYAWYADRPSLQTLWAHRAELKWEDPSWLAAVVSERANGSITHRPWASAVPSQELLHLLGFALVNLPYFFGRAARNGVQDAPYVRGVAYLALAALDRHTVEDVHDVLENVWDHTDGDRYPSEARDHVARIVIGQLVAELQDVCIEKCRRVDRDPMELSEDEIRRYWGRLQPAASAPSEEDEDRRTLMIENSQRPCDVGFPVGTDRYCPLVALGSKSGLADTLAILKHVVDFRHRGLPMPPGAAS